MDMSESRRLGFTEREPTDDAFFDPLGGFRAASSVLELGIRRADVA